jgi:hypothetical protein
MRKISDRFMMSSIKYFLLFLLLFTSCTENPFFDDENSAQDKYIVRGKISLSDNSSPHDIYVWMKDGEFELSARTNSAGDFSIQLPRTGILSGYNGTIRIYYYAGNYKINYSTVLIVDGKFEYDKYDITKEGFIKETVILYKLLDITTRFTPAVFTVDYSESVNVEVQVTNLDTNLLVKTKMIRTSELSALIFKEVNSSPENAIRLELPGSSLRGYYLSEPVVWPGQFSWQPNFLPKGQYEVYPYIFLEQENDIPPELLESFGNRANEFSDAYLKIPFKHNSDLITIN